MDYDKLILCAINQINTLPNNTTFVLKDLFVGSEWNALATGNRLQLGRVFKNLVVDNCIPHTVYIGKAKNNSARYQIDLSK